MIAKKIIVPLLIILAGAGLVASLVLVRRSQDLRELAATSAPSCPAGTISIETYGECCGCRLAKEVRRCRYPDGRDTYRSGSCDHSASGCTSRCSPTSTPRPTSRQTECSSGDARTRCQDPKNQGPCATGYGVGFRDECQNGHWVNLTPSGDCLTACAPAIAPTPTGGGDQGYCSLTGKTRVSCSSLPGDFFDCETNPSSLGTCCEDGGNPYCCWSNGTCSGGQRGGCEDAGNGCIRMPAGTYQVDVCHCSDGACPCSQNCQTISRTWSEDNQSQCFFGTYECGQADVHDYCASCKTDNCSPPPPPSPTPTPTPIPSVIPSPTPTPDYSCDCLTVQAYDADGQQITDFSEVEIGTTIRFVVAGETDHPEGLTMARFRINNGDWDETSNRWQGNFYVDYVVDETGNYSIEAQVYNPGLRWR